MSDASALQVLGYVDAAYDEHPEISGVTFVDRKRTFPGPRLYSTYLPSGSFLIDIDGEVLHHWAPDVERKWTFGALLDDGDIVVVDRDRTLKRIGKDSSVRWTVPVGAHHDLDVWDDTIVVLTREDELREESNPINQTTFDFVSFYSLEGEFLSKISLLDTLLASRFAHIVPSVRDIRFADDAPERFPSLCRLHANHVEVIDAAENWMGRPSGRPRLLITLRNINAAIVMDLETLEVQWLWGPNTLTFPHHASLLPTGNVMVFNNGLEQSSVIEIDPQSFDVSWRYSAPGFFSSIGGGAQRLPNGNTLISESNRGRVFEVNSKGDIVWDWKNPDVSEDGKRGTLFRMVALEETPEWLQDAH